MHFPPIGTIRTCFTEKFGVPRQPRLVAAARGVVRLHPAFSDPAAVLGLRAFSHVWILFAFDRARTPAHPAAWSPTVSPPGSGAPEKVGVFASRSPHRPNPIGMSAVELIDVRAGPDGTEIHVGGVDILDGSPVLDVKPYVPYADSIPAASHGWTDPTGLASPLPGGQSPTGVPPVASLERLESPRSARGDRSGAMDRRIPRYEVRMEPRITTALGRMTVPEIPDTDAAALVTQMLALDPRPRSQREMAPIDAADSVGRRFAFRMLGHDFHWVIEAGPAIRLVEIRAL